MSKEVRKPGRPVGSKDSKNRKMNDVMPSDVAVYFEMILDSLDKNLKAYSKENDLKNWKYTKEGHSMRRHDPQKMMDSGMMYIKNCITMEKKPTFSFLCQSMGISTVLFRRMAKETPTVGMYTTDVYSYPLMMMKGFIAGVYEFMGETKINPSFTIFMLKNLGLNEDKPTNVIPETADGFTPEERMKLRDKLNKL